MNYKNDECWKKVQKYLPPHNRLTKQSMPEENYVTVLEHQIHIDHYKVRKPKARIILFHGVGGNGRLLSFIAAPLKEKGYEVICPDLPLYGYTKYKSPVTYETWVNCGIQVVKHFHKDEVPIFLFGLSAGGLLAYQVATAFTDLSGVIATCILDQRNKYITKRTAKNPFFATIGNSFLSLTYKVFPSIKLPMKLVTDMKSIANDKELATLLMKDKKSSGSWVPLSFLYTMLHPIIKIEPEDFLVCPFLLVHPENDQWTELSLSKLFFDRLACEKELKLLQGAGHFPIEKKGLEQLEEFCHEFMERCVSKSH